jgi:hypothetical protein
MMVRVYESMNLCGKLTQLECVECIMYRNGSLDHLSVAVGNLTVQIEGLSKTDIISSM